MPDSAAEIKRIVLIVDRSAESREVLRTVLARRGLEILEAAGARAGLELCRRHHPEVVVLDLDSAAAGDDQVCAEFETQVDRDSTSLVLLGAQRRLDPAPVAGRCVPKPYHYAPLVRTIEELLGTAEKMTSATGKCD